MQTNQDAFVTFRSPMRNPNEIDKEYVFYDKVDMNTEERLKMESIELNSQIMDTSQNRSINKRKKPNKRAVSYHDPKDLKEMDLSSVQDQKTSFTRDNLEQMEKKHAEITNTLEKVMKQKDQQQKLLDSYIAQRTVATHNTEKKRLKNEINVKRNDILKLDI